MITKLCYPEEITLQDGHDQCWGTVVVVGDILWTLDTKERLWERRNVTADNIQGRSIINNGNFQW